ncbi:MAG: hypothetical protein SFV20_13805 [Sphingopyxis sp.]|nr:hypothetical protein [Sphingopyxis sp.]
MAEATTGLSTAGDSNSNWAAIIDRWIFVFMAALFFVTALAGFVPDSLMKVELVAASKRPPFPMILHVHAALMGAWLTLLLVQATLMATGNRAHHMKLGVASLVLAPAIVISGFILVPTIYGQYWDAAAVASGTDLAGLQADLERKGNILLRQIQGGLLFSTFVILALRARKLDPGFHKRMMFLATVVPLPAAIARLTWLPSTAPASPLSLDLYTLAWIAPMFLWDFYRQHSVHRAYIVWLALWVPTTVVVNALWGTGWWQSVAPKIMGFG